jgi:hypothetical protein
LLAIAIIVAREYLVLSHLVGCPRLIDVEDISEATVVLVG